MKTGVTEPLVPEHYYYITEYGETVDSKDESISFQATIEITNPNWILFGDELDTDTLQKKNGNVGGQKCVSRKDKSSHKDRRFTLIGITAVSGKLVMVIILLR